MVEPKNIFDLSNIHINSSIGNSSNSCSYDNDNIKTLVINEIIGHAPDIKKRLMKFLSRKLTDTGKDCVIKVRAQTMDPGLLI